MVNNGMNKPPVLKVDRGIMIAWKKECYRSSATAHTFGLTLAFIPGTSEQKGFSKFIAYINSMIKTFLLLRREKPRSVFCLNQPPFLPLVCFLYTKFTVGNLILDFHSGALTKWYWKPFQPLYRYLVRRSSFILCHNRQDGAKITKWGGRSIHLLSLPEERFQGISYRPREGRPLIFFICSFAKDEIIEPALNAMFACTEIDFIISGNYRKYGLVPADLPDNVSFAGFIDYQKYLATMAQSTAILTLSNRRHIMQMAVEEALTIGTPVVTNNSPAIMEVLGDGAVYLNELESPFISSGLRYAVKNHEHLASAMINSKNIQFSRIADELATAKSISPSLFI